MNILVLIYRSIPRKADIKNRFAMYEWYTVKKNDFIDAISTMLVYITNQKFVGTIFQCYHDASIHITTEHNLFCPWMLVERLFYLSDLSMAYLKYHRFGENTCTGRILRVARLHAPRGCRKTKMLMRRYANTRWLVLSTKILDHISSIKNIAIPYINGRKFTS